MPRKRPPTRAEEITDALYERAKARGLPLRGLYAASLKRVRDLIEEVGDADEVEVVARAALDLDGDGYAAHRTLSWGFYSYVRDALDVPDGGWSYALLLERLEPGRLRDSVDYWLRRWRGAEDVDDAEAQRARQQLAKLAEAAADEAALEVL